MENDQLEKDEESRKTKILDAFFNFAREAFIFLDDELGIVRVNSAFEAMYGLTEDILKGKRLSDLFPDSSFSNKMDIYQNVLNTGQQIEQNEILSNPHKPSERMVRIYAYKVENGLGLIINDLTQLSHYEKNLEMLHESIIQISNAKSIDELHQLTLHAMLSLVNFDYVSCLVVEGGYLREIRPKGETPSDRKLPLNGKGLVVQSALTQKTIRISDVSQDPFYIRGLIDSKSELDVPIVVDGVTIGVLNAESKNYDAFSREDEHILEILAARVSLFTKRIQTKKELSDSELIMEIILNEVTDGLYITDINDNFIIINKSLVTISGYSKLELMKINACDLLSSDSKIRQPALRANLLKTKSNFFEFDIISKNGELIPLEINTRLITYRGKTAIIGIARDLRERRKNEARLTTALELLRSDEERIRVLHKYTTALLTVKTFDEAAAVTADTFRNLLSTSTGGLALVEGGVLNFRYLYGVDPKSTGFLPLDGFGITVRAVRTGVTQLVPDITKDKDYTNLKGININSRSELAVPVKINNEVVALINVESPIYNCYNENDQRILEIFANYLGNAILNIRTNEILANYQKRLENLNVLLLRLDSVRTIEETIDVSQDLLSVLFKNEHQGIALMQNDVLVSQNFSGEKTQLPISGQGISLRAIRENRIIYVEDVDADPNFVIGEIEAKSELVIPIRILGKPIGVLNIESLHRNAFSKEDKGLAELLATHISMTLERIFLESEKESFHMKAVREEAEAEHAKELANLKTRFISTATHEIRTPLTSINGYAGLILENLAKNDYSNIRVYFEAVKRNAERLTRLSDDMLDTQRIEEGRLELKKTRVPIRELTDEIAREVTPFLKKRDQVIKICNNGDFDVFIDHDRINQVLFNLIDNSSKFSPSNTEIEFEVNRINNEAVFTIVDHGIGISSEDIPKLFHPFPNIHVKGNKRGTGLGLSICKGIIELHGGRMWVESKGQGLGSSFSFTLPFNDK